MRMGWGRSSDRWSDSTARRRLQRCLASPTGARSRRKRRRPVPRLGANQLDFVALIVEHLTLNGTMNPGQLYEPPFNRPRLGRPESLFPEADVVALVAAIRAVGQSAQPQDAVA